MEDNVELWSLSEKRAYTIQNAMLKLHKGVFIYCSVKGEPLVVKKR